MARGEPGTIAIDHKKIEDRAYDLKMSFYRISAMMGYNQNWMGQTIREKRLISQNNLDRLAAILDVDPDDLIAKNTPDPSASVTDEVLPESDIEKEMREFMKFVKEELAAQKSILMYLYNQEQQRHSDTPKEVPEIVEKPKKPELEQAMDVLNQMLENKSAVRYAEYMLMLDRQADIRDHRMADAAIAKLGHVKKLRGFGTNKAMWIGKRAYFEEQLKGEEE